MGVQLGRYELLGRIGTGGMAEVFLARLRGVEGFARDLVVKRMRSELVTRPDAVKMFLDEARLLAKIQHPNIVQVFDLGEAEGTYFIAMEFVDGPHLGKLARHVIREGQALPLLLSAFIVDRAADGLHFAHEATDPDTGEPLHLVHRDISPHNILISRFGDVKVADFGVAKARGQATETKSGVVKGKIAYMSPEQVLGDTLDRRSDVFALGIVLFELVTSRRLFKHKSELVSMQRITQEDAPLASTYNADVDASLDAIIARALARDRHARYPTMAALKADLDTWIGARAKGHLKSELARFVSQHGPRLEVDRDVAAFVTPMARTLSLSDGDRVTVPGQDSLVAALVRDHGSLPDDIHDARTRIEEPPATREVEGAPVASDAKSGSASHASLSTHAFGALKTNLQRSASRFVGRRADLEALERASADGATLITLVGPAGTGKTRLAQRFAELKLKELSDDGGGAWFCDLTTARTAEQVASALAEVLRIPLTSARTVDDIVDLVGTALLGRGRVLIVLDNFEQLVEHGPVTVERWLGRAPAARFVVTSREVLRLPGEIVVEVPPLSLPRGDDELTASEAVQLFVERARAVKPGYAVSEKDQEAVGEIVRRLDGIPLAIELAAARMGVLPASKILERLSRRFDLLKGGTRSSSPRQAALRSALDWSWDLLTVVERDALAQCSVFHGGFSIEDAEAVIDLSAHDDAPFALDVVQALKDKSLLRAADTPDFPDDARLAMYESVREYAAFRLDEARGRAAAEARHAAHFLDVALAFAALASGRGSGRRMARLLLELPNILAVHERATSAAATDRAGLDDGLKIATALEPFYAARGPFADQVRLLDAALEKAGEDADPALRVRALGARGRARRRLGLIAESRTDYVEALRHSKRAGLKASEAETLRDLGVLASDEGRLDDAERNYQDALSIQSAHGLSRDAAATLMYLAFLADERGLQDVAKERYERAQAALERTGERRLEGLLLGNYAGFAQERGDLDAAERHLEGALRILADCGDRTYEAPFLGYLGTLRHEQGRPSEAITTLRRSLTAMRETGNLRYEGLMEGFLAAALASADQLDEARLALSRSRTRVHEVGDPRHAECVRLFEAFLLLAEARAARATGDDATARARVDEVVARVRWAETRAPSTDAGQEPASPAERSDDIRRALRILKRGLAAMERGASS